MLIPTNVFKHEPGFYQILQQKPHWGQGRLIIRHDLVVTTKYKHITYIKEIISSIL